MNKQIVKRLEWSESKNRWLIKNRGISFEEVKISINNGKILKIINHTNEQKYPNQKMALLEIKNYIYIVPYIEDKEKIFLKTIYPSRKYTKQYLT